MLLRCGSCFQWGNSPKYSVSRKGRNTAPLREPSMSLCSLRNTLLMLVTVFQAHLNHFRLYTFSIQVVWCKQSIKTAHLVKFALTRTHSIWSVKNNALKARLSGRENLRRVNLDCTSKFLEPKIKCLNENKVKLIWGRKCLYIYIYIYIYIYFLFFQVFKKGLKNNFFFGSWKPPSQQTLEIKIALGLQL